MKVNKNALEFEWDEGNKDKNLKKHNVDDKEVEEAFWDKKKKFFRDVLHSKGEKRFRIVGKTEKSRLLFIVFTMRENKIRIISARDINKKEVKLYEEKT